MFPELRFGDTLTEAKNNLPDLINHSSSAVVFDQSNPDGTKPLQALAVLYDSQSTHFQDVTGLTFDGASVFIGGIAYEVEFIEGTTWEFTELPFSLKKRLIFDETRGEIGFKGFNDRIGDVVFKTLLPNVMTAQDLARAQSLDDEDSATATAWDNALEALYLKTRNPEGLDLDGDNNIDDEVLVGFDYAKDINGNDTSDVITTDPTNGRTLTAAPAKPAASTPASERPSFPAGSDFSYLTIAENNGDLPTSQQGNPVDLHVIKIVNTTDKGHVVVINDENVLSERVTLRFNLDFAGRTDEMNFEWFIQPATAGGAPDMPNADNPASNGWQAVLGGFNPGEQRSSHRGRRTANLSRQLPCGSLERLRWRGWVYLQFFGIRGTICLLPNRARSRRWMDRPSFVWSQPRRKPHQKLPRQ